jgi:tetratricopeptide (TPR) repeat protein
MVPTTYITPIGHISINFDADRADNLQNLLFSTLQDITDNDFMYSILDDRITLLETNMFMKYFVYYPNDTIEESIISTHLSEANDGNYVMFYKLGKLYSNIKNYTTMEKYYLLAMEHDIPKAQQKLAEYYHQITGDYDKAISLYHKSGTPVNRLAILDALFKLLSKADELHRLRVKNNLSSKQALALTPEIEGLILFSVFIFRSFHRLVFFL